MDIEVIMYGGPVDGGITTLSTPTDYIHVTDPFEGKLLVYTYRRRPGTLVYDYESTDVDYDYEGTRDDRRKHQCG